MIAIIKYNAGNTRSVQNALHRLGTEWVTTDDPVVLQRADKVIFPGVGEASSAMNYIRKKGLDQVIRSLDKPFLGICLGLQLMCRRTEEGDTDGLGVFDSVVRAFPREEIVPHIGWNNFTEIQGDLFNEVSVKDDFYYVHGYYADLCDDTIAICDYILPFSAALSRDNFYATQFHPEKSSSIGQTLLSNFLNL